MIVLSINANDRALHVVVREVLQFEMVWWLLGYPELVSTGSLRSESLKENAEVALF